MKIKRVEWNKLSDETMKKKRQLAKNERNQDFTNESLNFFHIKKKPCKNKRNTRFLKLNY